MKYTLLILAAMALTLTSSAQDAMSVYIDKPMTIDGKPYEWPAFFRFYAPGTKFQFDVLNDKTNLYLCVRATELEAQTRLLHSGLTIWIDPSGKKKQKTGFSFPMKLDHSAGEGFGGDEDERRNQDPGSGRSLHSRVSRLRERVLLSQASVKPIGLPGISDQTLLALTTPGGINIAYGWDSLDILYVEYEIPLSVILGHTPTTAELNSPIGLGLVAGAKDVSEHHGGGSNTGAMDNASNGGMGGSHGSRGGGQGMGGRQGGMTGQGHTMSGPSYDPNAGEQKTWLKLHLENK